MVVGDFIFLHLGFNLLGDGLRRNLRLSALVAIRHRAAERKGNYWFDQNIWHPQAGKSGNQNGSRGRVLLLLSVFDFLYAGLTLFPDSDSAGYLVRYRSATSN
jgi:hypothetical protein